jgi:hypothetical protein|tara:strand:- start:453 stop:710 length:258 start_codon:yes stop_codon:yes gene_type:complete
MGKKSTRSQQISKGVHSTVNSSILKELRQDYLASPDRLLNQLKAHRAGKKVMVTIPNPNKNATNKRFIRVPASVAWNSGKLKQLA